MQIQDPILLRKFHPLANLFGYLTGGEFQELVEDIRRHGLIEPIVLYEDMILDGRNRYRACLSAKVEPRFKPYGVLLGGGPIGDHQGGVAAGEHGCEPQVGRAVGVAAALCLASACVQALGEREVRLGFHGCPGLICISASFGVRKEAERGPAQVGLPPQSVWLGQAIALVAATPGAGLAIPRQ